MVDRHTESPVIVFAAMTFRGVNPVNPTPGDKNLYFVARGGGHHLFSATYEQHLANIRSVRGRIEAAESDSVPVAPPVIGSKR